MMIPTPVRLGVLILIALPVPATAVQCTIETMVSASDAGAGDTYGFALALSGDTVVVGSPQDDDLGFTSGSAYVLERNLGGTNAWGESAKLLASDGSASDRFGYSVAISGDTIVVGAINRDAAYVFERDFGGPDNWGETAKLVASDGGVTDAFGLAVAIDGSSIVIGAPYAAGSLADTGAAYVYERDFGGPGNWGEVHKLFSPEGLATDWFGQAVSIWGDTILVGAPKDELGVRGVIAGLANGPLPGFVHGSDHTFDELIAIAAGTGGGTTVGSLGFASVRGLAFDPGTNVFYGSDVATDQLVAIDAATGSGTVIGPLGFGAVEGLAFDPQSGVLYGTDTFSDQLLTIDTATGAGSAVGALGYPSVRGLAFDPNTGSLFGADVVTETLVRIDTATGSGTLLAALSEPDVQGLAFDPAVNVLYGVDTTLGLVVIDVATGIATDFLVPEAGVVFVFERNAGGPGAWGEARELSASDPYPFALFGAAVSISGDTAVAGAEDDFGQALLSGTAYVFERDLGGAGVWGEAQKIMASDGILQAEFGASVSISEHTILVGAPRDAHNGILASGSAYAYERDVGGSNAWGEVTKLVASDAEFFDGFGASVALSSDTMAVGEPWDTEIGGAVYLYGEVAASIYCTAGTSASGCRAQISASGTPSATLSSGFVLGATNVEGRKAGIFYYGANGRHANPWGNGTSLRCVMPPVKRGGTLAGTGTNGACDGVFAQDLNARWCPTCVQPGHNFGAGAVVQAQLWYRDPKNTSSRPTSLSDAIEFVLCP